MNPIYRNLWNNALVATSLVSKKQSCKPLLITGLLVCSTSTWALPSGEQLMAGQATVSVPTANLMQIKQNSQQAVLNWQGFSVAPNETVNIQQPNVNATLLNRVIGQDVSQIQGQLNANGQVYLVNPNGVIFGKTAQVDVGGLVATTHNITNADFMNGKNHFTQNGATGTVENNGTIKTSNGGVVALISQSVSNTGTINTPNGTTALAAGKTVDLDFQGNGLVEVKISESALNAQISNQGAIQADGGRVVLTAKAAGQLIDTVINQQGIIRAQGLAQRNGEIILEAGNVSQTGTLDASGNTGGNVTINANRIHDTGITNTDGTNGSGGNIRLFASDSITQTKAANTHANGTTTGGTVHLEASNKVYSSGKLSATGEQGGIIDMVSPEQVVLAGANVDASGNQKGGLIRIGGDFHGANTLLPNAKTTGIDSASILKADGSHGQVVVWSDQQTDYYGSISANKAGSIEVSSKGLLNYAGLANAGIGGSLLLDPQNIIIDSIFNNTTAVPIPVFPILFATGGNGVTQSVPTQWSVLGIAFTLSQGTSIVMQANNDIIWNALSDINVSSLLPAGGQAGALTLQAGRNITLNSNIETANGAFTAIAGDPGANAGDRNPGTATISLNQSVTIKSTGKVTLVANGGNFVNNTGLAAPISASQWLVYSTDPRQNRLNGMTASKHYAQPYTGTTPGYATTGNWFLYSVTPTLTVTPSSQTISVGDTPASFTATNIAGFIDGDTSSTSGISGTGAYSVDNFTGVAGSYNVNYLSGLSSQLGYVFVDNSASINELTVKPETIVTPENPGISTEKPIEDIKTTVQLTSDESDFLFSQLSPLQQSTLYSFGHQQESTEQTDLANIEIENNGIKLPRKFHRVISLSIPCRI